MPVANEIIVHARQELVKRLDGYELSSPEVFQRVVTLIEKKMMPIINRHALSGHANINSEDPVFDEPLALAMLIDIFSERGYHAVVDVHRIEIPEVVDLKTGKITALAVTSRQRSRSAADIPTVAELGLKDLELEVLYIAMVPAATPEPVVQLLQKSFTDALKRPDTQAQLASMDLFYEGLTGQDAVKRLSDQSQRYGRVVKSTGMKVE